MIEDECRATLALNAVPSLGPTTLATLVARYGSAAAAVNAGPLAWGEAPGATNDDVRTWTDGWDAARSAADHDWAVVEHTPDLEVFLLHTGPYPARLRDIDAAPPIIYAQGRTEFIEGPAVALVGSRRASYYGERVARALSEGLARSGVATVSGCARGIDRVVHEETINASGKTVAVLGSGLLQIYPPEHRALVGRIRESGCVLSEFPLNTRPFPANFPRRNRIISGLSRAVVVIEGSNKSGSLITARVAAEQGREVLAVPGSLFSEGSAAPHRLIAEGARLVTTVEDVLEEIGCKNGRRGKEDAFSPALTDPEKRLLDAIAGDAVPKEWLTIRTGLRPEEASIAILSLELKGLVRCLPGGQVAAAGR